MLYKHKLNQAFKALREQGFVARQSFKCCSSCAGWAVSVEFAQKTAKDPNFTAKGFVYYHQQDVIAEKEIRRAKWSERCPSMMLRFGRVEFEPHDFNGKPLEGHENLKAGKWGIDDTEIGKAVCRALDAAGLEYKWDGNPSICIEVFPFGKEKKRGESIPMEYTHDAVTPPGVAA
jgi:hypothetical protein